MAKFSKKVTDATEVEGFVTSNPSTIQSKAEPTTPQGPGSIKEYDTPNQKLKTEVAAEAVAGSSSSSNMGAASPAVSFAAGAVPGGGAGAIGRDVSATTRGVSNYRSGDRVARREDQITRKVDYIRPETCKPIIKQSKAINETSDTQGYNGNYYNEHALVNKRSGVTPADPNFDRDTGVIANDMLYTPYGQYNNARVATEIMLDGTDQVIEAMGYGEYAVADYIGQLGNPYQLKDIAGGKGTYYGTSMHVTFNQNNVPSIEFINEYNTANYGLDEDVTRLAGDAALRQFNLNEKERLLMIDNAGDETSDKWCPLGQAIPTPSAVNTVLKDLDVDCGNQVALSYRKLTEAHSYFINKCAKDGTNLTGPVADFLNGCIDGDYSTATAHGLNIHQAMNHEAYAAGGAGLYLAVSDSIGKYDRKGKFITLPLSFHTAIATAEANFGVLRASDYFLDQLKKNELFSTIDAPYDGEHPIYMTDKANVAHSIAWSTQTCTNGVIQPLFTLHWEDERARYSIPVRNFFLQGILNWLANNAARIVDALSYRNDQGQRTVVREFNVPVVSSATSLSLWDLIVCASVPEIVRERARVMRLVISYQKNFGYPYSGSTELTKDNVTAADNYGFTSWDSGLQTHIMAATCANRIKMPEILTPVNAGPLTTGGADESIMWERVILPWYFSEDQFTMRTFTPSGVYVDDPDEVTALRLSSRPSVMNYPSQRAGVIDAFLDSVYDTSESVFRKSLDRMVVYPGYMGVGQSGTARHGRNGCKIAFTGNHQMVAPYAYKHGFQESGIPVIPYVSYMRQDSDELRSTCLTILDVISTPREFGDAVVAPAGLLTPVAMQGVANRLRYNAGYLAVSGPGYRLYHWSYGPAQALMFDEEAMFDVDTDELYVKTWDVVTCRANENPVIAGIMLTPVEENITPFTDGGYVEDLRYNSDLGTYEHAAEQQVNDEDAEMNTYVNYDWYMLQRMDFVINPFSVANNTLEWNHFLRASDRDPFENMIKFGFCGFKASEYSADTNTRNKARISLGMNYVTDALRE